MTVEPAAGAVASQPQFQGRFETFAELREEHLKLRESFSETVRISGAPQAASKLREFVAKVQKTGAILAQPGMRKAAQGVLYYWGAELARLPDRKKEDLEPTILAPLDPAALRGAAQTIPESAPGAEREKAVQRELIRISAIARQWRDSGKQPGYLLTGKAILAAALFADQDPNLDEFITASERANKRRRRWLIFGAAAGVSLSIVLSMASFYYWQFHYLPATRDQAIRELKVQETATPARQAETLRWLSDRQSWLPPYDFVGAVKIKQVRLPGLTMLAANFSRVNFDAVEFPNANLNAVSFSGSEFSFDGNGGRNDFKDAVLWRALFRNARIASTSFAGADLYRAIFDRAILCDVDFAGASLRSASFWAATLDTKTEDNLIKNVAWWQAVGWPWKEIEKLATPHQNLSSGSAVSEADIARNARLKQSRSFQEDMRDPKDNLARAAPGSLDRVLALNDMAWTLAIWGVDIAGPKSQDPCTATGVPANGLQAAEQAVCIATKLNSEGERKGVYKNLLSYLRDTLAYIQMQRGEMEAAIQTFQEMGKDDPAALENSESTQFRYAIAQYATAGSDEDKNAAIQRFTAAVKDRLYQPSHELQTLRDYIFPVKEFVDVLRASSNRLWPQVDNQAKCPAGNPAGTG